MRTQSIPVLVIVASTFTVNLSLLANADPPTTAPAKGAAGTSTPTTAPTRITDLITSDFTMSEFLKELDAREEDRGKTVVFPCEVLHRGWWEETKQYCGIKRGWLMVLVFVLPSATILLILWLMIHLIKYSVRHGHFKFVLSASILPGVLAFFCSAIFSSEFVDRLDDEPESFILPLVAGFVLVWIL